MEIIQSEGKFNRYRTRVNHEVFTGSIFPRQTFKRKAISTRFFDSGWLTSVELFEVLRSLCNEFEEDGFVFGVISPDPERFARDHSGSFPAARFLRNDSSSSFRDFVMYGSNDAIAFQTFEIVILSDNGAFAVYGKRIDEYAVVSTFKEASGRQQKTPSVFSENFLMNRSALFERIKNFKNFKISKQEFFDAWDSAR